MLYLLIPFFAALTLAYYAAAPEHEKEQILKMFMEVIKKLSDTENIRRKAALVNTRARAAMPDLLRSSKDLQEIWIGTFVVQVNVHMADLRAWYSGLGLQCPFSTPEDLPAEDWKLIAGAARNNIRYLIIEHTEYTNAREAIVAGKAGKASKRRKSA